MATFEVTRCDAAGRLGTLPIPSRGEITTPALLPVINPNIDTITAAEIEAEFDPAGFITNSYIIYRTDELRSVALDSGVHDLLGVDSPVMTDSGSFQLAEYGEIDVESEEIVEFQRSIGADIVTPIDIPTPPSASREQAEKDVSTSLDRTARARELVGDRRLLSGPVQGGTYHRLRTDAGRAMRRLEADLYPIGAVVPLMESYRFVELVDVVVAAKRGIGIDAPVHLFGAGHPMMFSLAAAMGCDLFDSAAYALFARDGRYLTTSGTIHLDELEEFPCRCPACLEGSPRALRDASALERERRLARHNLHVSLAELRLVRSAIRSRRLLDLVERRARNHPAVFAGYRRLLEHDTFLERQMPAIGDSMTFFTPESAQKPAVLRHHRRLRQWDATGEIYIGNAEIGRPDRVDERWKFQPPFGPIPPGLAHTYPFTVDIPEPYPDAAYVSGARGVIALLDGIDATVTVDCSGWPVSAIELVPESIVA